ncbi:hypothetical protein IWZ01DRAFT_228125 [Phyllosticta capitalensis]
MNWELRHACRRSLLGQQFSRTETAREEKQTPAGATFDITAVPAGHRNQPPMWTTPSRADILNTRANGIIIFTTKTAARPPSPHHLRVVSSQLPKRRSEQRLFPHHHHLSYHRRRRGQVTAERHDGDLRRAASINVVPVSPAQTTPDTCIFESFLAAALFVHQARTLQSLISPCASPTDSLLSSSLFRLLVNCLRLRQAVPKCLRSGFCSVGLHRSPHRWTATTNTKRPVSCCVQCPSLSLLHRRPRAAKCTAHARVLLFCSSNSRVESWVDLVVPAPARPTILCLCFFPSQGRSNTVVGARALHPTYLVHRSRSIDGAWHAVILWRRCGGPAKLAAEHHRYTTIGMHPASRK